MPHVGSLDVDLSLDAEALGDGEYATLVDALMEHGYEQREDPSAAFSLSALSLRRMAAPPIDIVVDFLMPRDVEIVKNSPPLVADFAAQKADGADLATHFYQFVAIDGSMPDGGPNRVEIAVCSIPALLAMKGHALNGRLQSIRTPYDIYYCIRNYRGGPEALAAACRLFWSMKARAGATTTSPRNSTADGVRADRVRRFVGDTPADGRTPEQWQQDAFGQVDAWVRALGLR